MKNTKLIRLYSSLNKHELVQLHKVVHSPALNKHRDVTHLYEFIRANKSTPHGLTKAKAFKAIFPGQVYDDLKLRHIISYLLKLIENMLILNESAREGDRDKVLLFRAYKSKEGAGEAEKLAAKIGNYFSKATAPDTNFLLQKYAFQYELYDYNSLMRRNDKLNLQELSDDLDVFYAVSKLKVACNVLTHQNLFRKQYDIGLLNEVVGYIAEKDLQQIPLVQLYLQSYLMIAKPEEESHFQLLKETLFSHEKVLHHDELRNLYLLAINYCIRKLNDGKDAYYQEVYQLYKKSLDHEVLLHNGKLTPFTYKNIVSAGLKLKEFDWTEQFIYQYKNLLDQPYGESFFTFNLAKVYFEQKKYTDVVDLLHETHLADFLTSLGARVLLLKSFYELQEFVLLDALTTNFIQFLNRKKMIAYHKTNYRNFCKYLQKLMQKDYKNKSWLKQLEQSVLAEEILTERDWFLAKIAQ